VVLSYGSGTVRAKEQIVSSKASQRPGHLKSDKSHLAGCPGRRNRDFSYMVTVLKTTGEFVTLGNIRVAN